MSQIRITPRSIVQKRPWRCTGFDSSLEPISIRVEDMVGVLDSVGDGLDEYREYIVEGI